jgi:uncharacterized protein YdaU (DUF1376 family)
MSDGPWIKFYPSDWLTGTRGLSPAEAGIYITLIAMMYEKGGTLTGDMPKLARLCNCPLAPFQKMLDRLVDDGKLDRSGDGALTNKRVQTELATRQRTSIAASQSAALRWEKDKQNQSDADANAMRNASIAGAGQISEVRTQKEEHTDIGDRASNSVGSLSRTKAEPKSRGTRLSVEWVLPKSMGEWALAQGLPRDRILLEAEKMRDWSINAGKVGVKVDWFAAWRNWVKKAIDELPRARGSPPGRKPTGLAALTEEFRQELAEDGYADQGQEGRNSEHDARFPLLSGPDHR